MKYSRVFIKKYIKPFIKGSGSSYIRDNDWENFFLEWYHFCVLHGVNNYPGSVGLMAFFIIDCDVDWRKYVEQWKHLDFNHPFFSILFPLGVWAYKNRLILADK